MRFLSLETFLRPSAGGPRMPRLLQEVGEVLCARARHREGGVQALHAALPKAQQSCRGELPSENMTSLKILRYKDLRYIKIFKTFKI